MGYEYRLHTEPPLKGLKGACNTICSLTEWFQIPTSFTDASGIGIQFGEEPTDPKWPHAVDLYDEGGGKIYILCHSDKGRSFMNELVKSLKENGYKIKIDDDI